MKIRLNTIDFEVSAVASQLRSVVLTDPIVSKAVWRDVYRWDAATGKGKMLVDATPNGAVPLGNALTFFVPKVTTTGAVTKADSASSRMAARFLDAVGAKSIIDVVKALNGIVFLPQKTVPLATFAPLNPVLSYVVRMHVDFAVVQLRDAGRNLTAYLCVPGQVAFHHEITAIIDAAGYDALVEATPALGQPQPAFIVPHRTKANQMLRRIATAKRIEEMQPEITRLAAAPAETRTATADTLRRGFARAVAEWKTLTRAE